MTNLNDNETERDFNGMTLLVRSEVDEDDGAVSRDYCVVYGEKETDWITAGYVSEDEAFKQAQTWAEDIAESELEDTLQGTNGAYDWMLEGIDTTSMSDEDVVAHVRGLAEDHYKVAVADWVSSNVTLDRFMEVSDYRQALRNIQNIIEDQREEAANTVALEAIVTPAEIEALYGVKADTVRDACEREWIMARKSGSTWLIPAKVSKERWGKENPKG